MIPVTSATRIGAIRPNSTVLEPRRPWRGRGWVFLISPPRELRDTRAEDVVRRRIRVLGRAAPDLVGLRHVELHEHVLAPSARVDVVDHAPGEARDLHL